MQYPYHSSLPFKYPQIEELLVLIANMHGILMINFHLLSMRIYSSPEQHHSCPFSCPSPCQLSCPSSCPWSCPSSCQLSCPSSELVTYFGLGGRSWEVFVSVVGKGERIITIVLIVLCCKRNSKQNSCVNNNRFISYHEK